MNSVITEITDNNGGCVFYDAECRFCATWARRGERWLGKRGFRFAPLTEPADEMKLVTDDGETMSGARAAAYLARRVWWAWPLWAVSRVPGVMRLLELGYRQVAARRYCLRGGCEITSARVERAWDWLPGGLVLVFAVAMGGILPAWAWMWSLAAALFFGFKWITWIRAWRGGLQMGIGRSLGYWLLWPGLVPTAFARAEHDARPREWILACAKTALGALLVWGVARRVPANQILLVGWVGWVGLAFLLHFGVMHLSALAWRVPPIMRAPILATSLRDFWSARWNTAFRDLAQAVWFVPLRRRYGTGVATFGVFLASGGLHELVISVPARAGYGLPTLYFALQGLGMLLERKWQHNAVCGRLITWLIVAGPAFWLFHPSFIKCVVVPFLHVIGAVN
jgi:predicted DCC family thiol-disulfide oxidoreductase YuxK